MKKFNELSMIEKGSLVITGLYGLAGIGLMIYGSIKEKQALRELRDAVIEHEINRIKSENNKTNQED